MGRERLRRSSGCTAALLVAAACLYATPALASSPLYWSYPTVIDPAGVAGLTCPSASYCVGTDTVGNVLTSTDPTGGAGAWTITKVDHTPPKPPYHNDYLGPVSCPAPAGSLCVAVGENGIFTSADPTGGEGAWTSAGAVGGGPQLDLVAHRGPLLGQHDQLGPRAGGLADEALGALQVRVAVGA